MEQTERPRVAVWREVWLLDSETFVSGQVASMTRWEPYLAGLRRRPNLLGVDADYAPLTTTRLTSVRTQLLGPRGLVTRLAANLVDVDVRLMHAHFGTSAVHALTVARRAGLPLVVTFHGHDVTRTPRLPLGVGRQYRRRLTEVFDYADRLVAVSEFIASRLVDLGAPSDRVVIRPIGITTTHTDDDDLIPYDERRDVVFVGRLVPKKGVADLITAVSRLPGALAATTTVRIVGDGPLRGELERLAQSLGVRAKFLGHLSPRQVRQQLRSAQVLGGPSRTAPDGDAEGFGMVFLEAALQGLPTLAYRHGGVPEAVEDGTTGLLAPEGDVTALSARLHTLLADQGLAARMGQRGRARVLSDFDIQERTVALEDVYDDVAVNPRVVP